MELKQGLTSDVQAKRPRAIASEQSGFFYARSSSVTVRTALTGLSSPSLPVHELTLAYDRSIRSHLRWRLERATEDCEATAVVDELAVCSGIARIDLAVLNGALHGFEIKSERDTLTRLHGQSQYFSEVVDYMTLVVVDQFLPEATAIVPEWWGISVAHRNGRSILFDMVRDSEPNPHMSKLSFLEFLWRDEAYTLALETGIARGLKSASKTRVYRRLAEQLPWQDLHGRVLDKLRTRLSSSPGGTSTSRVASFPP